jgi:polyribonucleotide nucleotidyltransferase
LSQLGNTTVSAPISGTEKTLTFETGKLALLAGGAVVGRIGDTIVHATATASKGAREGIDFFPLTVDVEERMYASGKIPGSFFRREGKASDQATLTARLTDRPLRPSFPDGFRNDVHVVIQVLGADQENPHDVLAINAASAALMISDIPFEGPIGAVRIAYTTEGKWLAHPTFEEGDAATFELVVAGRVLPDGDVAVMMVEAGGTEKSFDFYEAGASKVDEAALAEGLEQSKIYIKEAAELQLKLVEEAGGAKPTMAFEIVKDYTDEIFDAVAEVGTERILAAITTVDKAARNAASDEAAAYVQEQLAERFPDDAKQIKAAFRSLSKKLVRKRIVEEGARIDGRGPRDIRKLTAEVGVLPTAHGSALFQRGETQALNVTTLGMPKMDQMLDTITPVTSKRYMHHYNFPPFSTGEPGRMMGPKRREIGHGLLAERALFPVVPSLAEFPYTLRVVSDIMSSNGSTSMASVCGSSLSLMDAGVPIKAAVAGIAMGLVYAEGKYTTLTDILGDEDAFGDMDFKVAGTADVVTALQLDTKIDGIPADVLAAALDQAKEARLTILEVMRKAIDSPRLEVGERAPKITSFEIPLDRIGEVIGPKGKVINALQQETGAEIAVDDDGTVGTVTIGSTDGGAVAEARRRIELILNPPTVEAGETYTGTVVTITKFGAFVNILPGRDGLVHISKLGGGKRIDRVEDVLDVGDKIEVRVDDVDPGGKIGLSPVSAGDDNGDGASEGGSSSSSSGASAATTEVISFEETWDAEAEKEFGDLGPAGRPETSGGDRGGDRGGRGRGPRRNSRR